jgi:DNA polymerase III epsilon subunit-like protein
MKYCFFDCETTGKPRSYTAPVTDGANWPRLVQVAWLVGDDEVDPGDVQCRIVRPDGFEIPQEASDIHGITTAQAVAEGRPLDEVLMELFDDAADCGLLVGHNVDFDRPIIGAELVRVGLPTVASQWMGWPSVCTMKLGTDLCKIHGRYGYKWPKLQELYWHLFGESLQGAHRADADMVATARCFYEMLRRGLEIQVAAKVSLDMLS